LRNESIVVTDIAKMFGVSRATVYRNLAVDASPVVGENRSAIVVPRERR
jgi:DeoR/GlpR family transcriptional regulator of sugar metabolism